MVRLFCRSHGLLACILLAAAPAIFNVMPHTNYTPIYLPVESAYSRGRGGSINGFKIRELFVRPHAEVHTFFYGVNFEFSVN